MLSALAHNDQKMKKKNNDCQELLLIPVLIHVFLNNGIYQNSNMYVGLDIIIFTDK